MRRQKVHSFSHQAMGTFFAVFVAGQEEDYSRSAAGAFFREIDRLEGFLSRFDERSEISRINRLKPGEILPVGIETCECLKLSFKLMVETGGAFNVNFRAIKNLNRGYQKPGKAGKREMELFNKSRVEVVRRGHPLKEKKSEKKRLKRTMAEERERLQGQEISGPRPEPADESSLSGELKADFFVSIFPLELIEQKGSYAAVRLDVPGAELDLDPGAIGKGYALEKAAGIFPDWGIQDFLINAGGSTVYGCGQKPWPVAVGGGFDFFRPGRIYLQGRSLSGSGHEVKGEHIFDPRRRRALSRHLAVWVSHPSPAVADGLSTAFMVMNLKEIEAYARTHPETWILVLSRDRKSHFFSQMDIYEPGV